MAPEYIPGTNSKKLEKLVSALAALVCAALYFSFTYPYPDWLDSPELMTASMRLGIFHPPGSPLAVILGHALSYLSFGQTPALLFFSGIWAGLTVYTISRINQSMWRHLVPWRNNSGRLLIAPAMAVALGLSPGLFSQALRTEVYTLGSFLALLVIYQTLEVFFEPDGNLVKRRLGWVGLLSGLGLAVHPLVALIPIPMVLGTLANPKIRTVAFNGRTMTRTALLFAAGASPLAFLGLMVHGWVDLRWGDPTIFTAWLRFISGATFSPTFSHGPRDMASNLYKFLLLLFTGAGWALLFTGVLGVYLLFRTKISIALGLLVTILAACVPLVLQRSFRLDNPDATGYMLVALAAMGIFANHVPISIAVALRRRNRLHYMAGAAVALLTVIYAAVFQVPGQDHSECNYSAKMIERTLKSLPKNSVVLVADFNLLFMLDYATAMDGLRPDITILYLRDLENPALRASLKKTRPDLEMHLPPNANLSASGIVRLAKFFPVSMDLGPHLTIDEPMLPIEPSGLLWTMKANDGGRFGALTERDMIEIQKRVFGDLDLSCNGSVPDSRTAHVLAWHSYYQALAAQHLSFMNLARYMIAVAKKAGPRDAAISVAAKRLDQ